jgi:hypothetical protein
MNAEMFVVWLRGYFDMREAMGSPLPKGLSGPQVQLIHRRLSEVCLADLASDSTSAPSPPTTDVATTKESLPSV